MLRVRDKQKKRGRVNEVKMQNRKKTNGNVIASILIGQK